VTLIVLLIIVGNIGHHQRPGMLNLQHTCVSIDWFDRGKWKHGHTRWQLFFDCDFRYL